MTDSRKALREQGLKTRTEVLGKKYVEAALNNVNDFNRGLQDLLNEYCWGAGWGGEGLTRRERSLINLGMLTALGRTHEVAVHVRGAKNNGLTNEQIAAVFLHTAIYCGVPAAVDSFRAASPVIAEWDAENAAQGADIPTTPPLKNGGGKSAVKAAQKISSEHFAARPSPPKTFKNKPTAVAAGGASGKPMPRTAGLKSAAKSAVPVPAKNVKTNAAFPRMKAPKK
jgi:4-carboxymuconolactone decarboxylase